MNFFQKIAFTFQQQGKLAQIIIINVAVFLMANISVHMLHQPRIINYLVLPVGGYEFIYKPWTMIIFMFTHLDVMHVFFNMILFYFSAQLFFIILGEKKLTYVYVMSGLLGAALVLILGLVFPGSFVNSYLLGASTSVMGVIMVTAIYAPNYNVALWGIINMPYKYFAALVFVLSTIVDFSLNTGGKIAHIGGAGFGLLYGYYLKKGVDLFQFSLFKRKKLKVVSHHKTKDDIYYEEKINSEHRLNELLEKISKSGYDSLTKKEKEELFQLSQKK